MDKRTAFYKFAEITTRQSRGAYWINLLQTYFDPSKIIIYSGMIKILFPAFPTSVLIMGSAIFLFLIEFVKYYIGKLDEKMGLWKRQSEYQQKQTHINPLQLEIRDTLIEVCKALKIKSKFKEL